MMNVNGIAALAAAYGGLSSGAGIEAAFARSVTNFADGSTVTTVRGTTGGVLSVSTAAAPLPRNPISGVDVTA